MKPRRRVLTYANVVASLALFIAISGGVVYAAGGLGKNAVKTKNIAANAVTATKIHKNAVKSKQLAPNAVTTAKIKKEAVTGVKVKKATLTRTQLAAGTLSGIPVAEFQSAAVPGLTTETPGGAPVPLTGTAAFTPAAGKSYELLLELKGTPVDGDGPGGKICFASVTVFDNGAALTGASIFANASEGPPFGYEPIGNSSTSVGLLSPGQPQALAVSSFGSTGCGPTTTAALRGVVVEFG